MSFFSQLQREVGAWSVHNFGEQLAHRPALGMIEELCELFENFECRNRDEVLDAVGDVTIYMADYFFRRGWSLAEEWMARGVFTDEPPRGVVGIIRWLAHSHLKGEQGIRGGVARHDLVMKDYCGQTLIYCEGICKLLGVGYIETVKKTWGRVSKRDWVENPDTAHEVVAAGQASALKVNRDAPTVPALLPKQTEP